MLRSRKTPCKPPLQTQSQRFNADIISRQIVGMIACLEKFLTEAEERGNAFFLGLLEKQHIRMKALFERNVVRTKNLFCKQCVINTDGS